MTRARSGSSSSEHAAAPNAGRSPGSSSSRPSTPCVTWSARPPTRLATTGRPFHIASVAVGPNGAYLARADLADEDGDHGTGDRYRRKAADLRTACNCDFWLDERGGSRSPSTATSSRSTFVSNMGHCLWTGIVDDALAPTVARHLLGEPLFSGWGVRTPATTMAAYNPVPSRGRPVRYLGGDPDHPDLACVVTSLP
jgi:glycogen debranching enzyme